MYKKVAKEMGLNKYQVVDIFRAQFDYVAEEMKKKEGASIRLRYLGFFKWSKFKHDLITKNKDKDEREN